MFFKIIQVSHLRWLTLLITRVAQEETPPLRLTVPFRVLLSPDKGYTKLEMVDLDDITNHSQLGFNPSCDNTSKLVPFSEPVSSFDSSARTIVKTKRVYTGTIYKLYHAIQNMEMDNCTGCSLLLRMVAT